MFGDFTELANLMGLILSCPLALIVEVTWNKQAGINVWVKTVINAGRRNSRVLWENILGGKGGVYCGLAAQSIFLEDDIDLRVEVWGRESQTNETALNKKMIGKGRK